MKPVVRIPVAALLCCAFLGPASVAGAAETVTLGPAAFSNDKLGVTSDLLGTAKIKSSGQRVPSPITHVNLYGPLGASLNLEGTAKCNAAELENIGPEACPANSRAGSGGGELLYEMQGELVSEKFTLALFIGDNTPGHAAVLVYLSGLTPIPVHEVLTASVIQGPRPYGPGLSLEVPLIKVLPEASFASASSAFLRLGTGKLAYYKTVHGRRTRLQVKGVVTPGSCPRGGWLVASQVSFQDGSSVTARSRIRCPKR
jgi:hypothetical protein